MSNSNVQEYIKIGKLLIEKKRLTKRGDFLRWIDDNLPIKQREAQRYMRLARNEGKISKKHSLRQCMNVLE